jgi:hypothetical protein
VRALVAPNGIITDRYTYDSWGNLIEQAGDTPNPFTWNGAYGYEFIPQGLLRHFVLESRRVNPFPIDEASLRWLSPAGTSCPIKRRDALAT